MPCAYLESAVASPGPVHSSSLLHSSQIFTETRMGSSSDTKQGWLDPQWVISKPTDAPGEPALGDLVMAWARDRATGEPRYIGELGAHQRGSNCNCECTSCGLPLIAVNAAKTTFRKRPHFRHPEGAQKDACLVLAARAALLEALRREGLLELPRRRQSSRVAGLSGEYYEAWVEASAEQVSIRDFSFRDNATAILTLDDGREMKVVLTGSVAASTSDDSVQLTPTIVLSVDDPSIAALTPDELRKRLRLLVEGATWCSHWNDGALAEAADAAAQEKAKEALDWLGDSGQLDAMPAETRRETLLHLKAKEILERERRIRLPNLPIEATIAMPNGEVLREQVHLPGALVQLESVVLEKHLGPIKPDVLARTVAVVDWPADQLLIEVTVTNTISEERLERIRRMNIPAIEVDISRMGGRVTEAEFARLVVEEQAGKRWLHHPRMAEWKATLERELQAELDDANEREEEQKARIARREEFERIAVTELGRMFLRAVQEHAELYARAEGDPTVASSVIEAALDKVQLYAEGLAIHGYKEAEDKVLWRHGGLIQRLLSIQQDKAVGYRITTSWQVINTIMCEHERQVSWHPLYLVAIKAYSPTMNQAQRDKYAEWRGKIREGLDKSEPVYQHDRRFDKLLALLFPEIAEPLGKLSTMGKMHAPQHSKPVAKPVTAQPRYESQFQGNSGLWLKGREYEEWKRQNPEAAKAWEARSIPEKG